MIPHFVSASCEGNLCSVCKAPAQHKLGEEIQTDTPKPPCPDCGRTWIDMSVTVTGDKKWRRECIHCGSTYPYNDDSDDIDICPACELEVHPVSFANCTNEHHASLAFGGRHNLTAYVCCAHYVMIVGTAGGCAPGEVMTAGIWRESAARNRVLSAENSELREALIDVCDDWDVHRIGRAYIRELRWRANRTGEAFDVETIRNRAADTVRALEVIVAKTSAMAETNAAHAELAKAVHGIAAILLGKS